MNIEISEIQFARMLTEQGFEVRHIDTPVEFTIYHGKTTTEILPVLHVINTVTDEPVKLQDFFKKYMNKKMKELFLSPDRSDIVKLFYEIQEQIPLPNRTQEEV